MLSAFLDLLFFVLTGFGVALIAFGLFTIVMAWWNKRRRDRTEVSVALVRLPVEARFELDSLPPCADVDDDAPTNPRLSVPAGLLSRG